MSEKVFKSKPTRRQRFFRLLKSVFDPRAIGHALKIVNYYNYTHVAELAKAQRGHDVQISPTVSFTNGQNVVLGDRARIGANVSIWAGNGSARIVIGPDVLIAPSVMITASNYRINEGAPVTDQAMKESDVTIGTDVWIGYGAVILPGVTIGDSAIIGAGAIVRNDVPECAIVSTTESHVIGYRFQKKPD